MSKVEGQRIDKITFDKKGKVLRYVVGNKLYCFNIESIVSLEKEEVIANTDIINATNIRDVYSLVTPSPYSMDELGIRGVKKIIIMRDDESTLEYGLDSDDISIRRAVVDGSNIFIVTENSFLRTDFNLQSIETVGTYSNHGGLFVINKGDTKVKVVATLGKTRGNILLYKYSSNSMLGTREQLEIHAHENNIINIAVSRDGKFVATASDCGTNIKIYSTESGLLYKSFKRGIWSTSILNISFNWEGTILACISKHSLYDYGSVHFFDIYAEEKNRKSAMLGFFSYIVPEDIANLQWSSSTMYITINSKTKLECEFSRNGVYHIVTYDGVYYKIPSTHTSVSDAYLLKIE